MATTYSTPGVYVVEQSIFPPSVAQVETAIPAFIGYTQIAMYRKKDDLLNVPKRISSLKDFQKYFGGPAKTTVSAVNLNTDNTVADVTTNYIYYLYDSLQLFFGNGGGDCYIVSVGPYTKTPALGDLNAGLTALRKADEPTLLLFPDAVNLGATDFYTLQKSTLQQCADLGDRFSVLDIRLAGPGKQELIDTPTFEAANQEFRDNIGVNNLKYGACYTPWLNAGLPKSFTYADISNSLVKFSSPFKLVNLVTPAVTNDQVTVKAIIDAYDILVADSAAIAAKLTTLLAGNASLRDKYDKLVIDFKQKAPDLPNIGFTIAAFTLLIDEGFKLAQLIDDINDPAVISSADLRTQINSVSTSLANTLDTLVILDNHIKLNTTDLISSADLAEYPRHADGTGTKISARFGLPFAWHNTGVPSFTNSLNDAATAFNAFLTANIANLVDPPANDTDRVDNMLNIEPAITKIYYNLSDGFDSITTWLNSALQAKEGALYASYPVYKTIIDYINSTPTLLPPSGAMVGVYANVDNARGVWKAPANVSLNYVASVNYPVEDIEQDRLNIDTNGGKSINVIRPFTGKGVLVWGARTLAGNDNEWRYIPVRRFFIMVEESVKKSTSWAVFEPNDANTWIKVQGMIENFLIIQWRNGALQGAKPADAFYVHVGLGLTMTSDDILNGLMNVEIGMAVVRPAEFIVLKFSHKLVTS